MQAAPTSLPAAVSSAAVASSALVASPPDTAASKARGWLLVAGLFVILTVTSGAGFYNHSLYMRALAAERGLPLATLSGAISLFFVVSGVTGLGVARFIERFDVRYSFLFGACVVGIALSLLGRVQSVVQLYLVYALFGLGYAATSLIPATTLVARWFVTKRSVALSVATTGLSLGGVLVTPLTALFIARYDMATVLPWLGLALIALVVPVALFTLRPWPPAAVLQRASTQARAELPGTSYAEAVTGRFFRFATLAYVLLMMSQVGGIAHQFTLGAERFANGVAATGVSVLATFSILGRLAGGVIVTRIPMRGFTIVNMLGQALGLALLAAAHSPGLFWFASACFGLTVGNLLMLQPLLMAEAFGLRDYGRIYATSQAVTTAGVALGPTAVGVLHDFMGGYAPALSVVVLGTLCGAGLFIFAGAVPRPRLVR